MRARARVCMCMCGVTVIATFIASLVKDSQRKYLKKKRNNGVFNSSGVIFQKHFIYFTIFKKHYVVHWSDTSDVLEVFLFHLCLEHLVPLV